MNSNCEMEKILKKQAIKTSDKKQAIKTSDKKFGKKTIGNMEVIRGYLRENGASKTSDIASYLGLSQARTREILSEMDDVISIGANRNKQYKLKAALEPDSNKI